MSDFYCIQDYLSKYKTLRILCEECKIKSEDKQCIYHILFKLGSVYSVFVSTFYSMKESLDPTSYQEPTLESFCDLLIRKHHKLIYLGVISNAYTFGKSLLAEREFQASEEAKSLQYQKEKTRSQNLSC